MPVAPAIAVYRVGTLTYTRAALISVFCWMLWGDLCLNLMESVIPRLVPLQLERLGASNALIGILTGSVFSLMNWFMNPLISTWSDRYRSSFGRRMPFILLPTPLLAFFLTGVGFSRSIAHGIGASFPGAGVWLGHVVSHVLPDTGSLSPTAQLTIGIIALMLVLWKFFDLFPGCVYYYLFADVIPQCVMGKFVCLFRLVATLGIVIFHYFLLQYADSYPRAIYLGCALLYLLAFTLLGLMVKEGNYPPPPPRVSGNPARSIAAWFRESFSIGFYWKYFLASACFRWAFVPFNTFLILYAQEQLHMSPGRFGHSIAIALGVQMPVLLLLGPFLDKYHPLRVGLIGYAAMLLAGVAGFFWIHNERTFFVYTLLEFVAIAVIQGSLSTLAPRLLPRQRYGQFCAANAMVSETGLLLLSWACGAVLDRFGEPYVYLWVGLFSLLGMGMLLNLFIAWIRRGGDEHFVAPGDFAQTTQGAA